MCHGTLYQGRAFEPPKRQMTLAGWLSLAVVLIMATYVGAHVLAAHLLGRLP